MKRNRRRQFVVCIGNEGYEGLLLLRKIYERLPDPRGEAHRFIRIAEDEDGDSALFPARHFLPIDVSREIEKPLRPAPSSKPHIASSVQRCDGSPPELMSQVDSYQAATNSRKPQSWHAHLFPLDLEVMRPEPKPPWPGRLGAHAVCRSRTR